MTTPTTAPNPTIQSPPSDLYVPKGCKTLAQIGDSQIRLGLQGFPFSGKTTSALTFPNPVILSYDRKVSAHKHRDDVILIPFHDAAFVNALKPKDGMMAPINKKEALVIWLSSEALKLSPKQTLIVDGITAIEEEFHIWFKFRETELALSKKGGIDGYVEWNMKKMYFEELHSLFKTLPCNVVMICHEVEDRNDKGDLNGKVRPLLTGQAGDKLGGNLTDYFRQIAIGKPSNPEELVRFAKKYCGGSEAVAKEYVASVPPLHETVYLWQTCEDEFCNCGTSSLKDAPKYLLPNYNSFLKYRR